MINDKPYILNHNGEIVRGTVATTQLDQAKMLRNVVFLIMACVLAPYLWNYIRPLELLGVDTNMLKSYVPWMSTEQKVTEKEETKEEE